MEIDLNKLKDDLYGWYYEGYGRGIDSFLSIEEAQILSDCIAVVDKAIKDDKGARRGV